MRRKKGHRGDWKKKKKSAPFLRGLKFDWLAATTLVVVGHAACLNLGSESFSRNLILSVVHGATGAYTADYLAIDEAFCGWAQKGNVLLRFEGFDPSQSPQEHYIVTIYYRAVYALYPKRVYCGRSEDIINNGRDIANIAFSPDERWLDDHHVATIITFRLGADGVIGQEIQTRGIKTRGEGQNKPASFWAK